MSPAVTDWHNPDDREYDYYNLGIYFAKTADSLAFATLGNVFALDAESGKLRFEWVAKPARASEPQSFWFDDGTFQVRRGNVAVCAGKAGGARVFATCENKFFYFDNAVAVVIEPAGKIVAQTAWRNQFTGPGSKPVHEYATIPLGPYSLYLEGMIFMR